jgi:hypothetical protein
MDEKHVHLNSDCHCCLIMLQYIDLWLVYNEPSPFRIPFGCQPKAVSLHILALSLLGSSHEVLRTFAHDRSLRRQSRLMPERNLSTWIKV